MPYTKPIAALLSVALLLLIASPVRENLKAKPQDGFPLSYYPMFSLKREAHYTVNYVVGYDQQGQPHIIPYKLLGTGGFNQVRRQLNKRCKQGKAHKVARSTNKRIVQQTQAPYTDLIYIEVIKGDFHLDNFFLNNDRTPVRKKVLASEVIDRQNAGI